MPTFRKMPFVGRAVATDRSTMRRIMTIFTLWGVGAFYTVILFETISLKHRLKLSELNQLHKEMVGQSKGEDHEPLQELQSDIVSIEVASSSSNKMISPWAASECVNGTGLHIQNRDAFLLYEFPGWHPWSTMDFTIEVWYKTPKQPALTEEVAIISNLRHSGDGDLYGRHFIIAMLPTGQISVEFSAGDFKAPGQGNTAGKMQSKLAYDDDQWHYVSVVRWYWEESLELFVDFELVSQMNMPKGLDVDSQEQRVIIGGGNDRAFRECFLDELVIRTMPRRPVRGKSLCVPSPQKGHNPISSPSPSTVGDHLQVPEIIAYFPFEQTDGARFTDYSSMSGDSLVVGFNEGLVLAPGVPATLNRCPCPAKHSTPAELRKEPEGTRTVIVTSIDMSCNGDQMQTPGSFWQFDAMFAGLFLDINRLGLPLYVITGDCVPEKVVDKFSTEHVKFLRLGKDVHYRFPDGCHKSGDLWINLFNGRWFALKEIILSGFLDKYTHVVQVDLRDTRINRLPLWTDRASSTVTSTAKLWIQGYYHREQINGGFHGGVKDAVLQLHKVMCERLASQYQCVGDDQIVTTDLLIGNFDELGIPRDLVVTEGTIINVQQTRTFDQFSAFTHGNWVQNKKRPVTDFQQRYPRGIPYLGKRGALSATGG